MMDLLRKFEEEQSQEMERGRGLGLGLDSTGEVGDAETDDEDEDPSGLARRFAAVDLSAYIFAIWFVSFLGPFRLTSTRTPQNLHPMMRSGPSSHRTSRKSL